MSPGPLEANSQVSGKILTWKRSSIWALETDFYIPEVPQRLQCLGPWDPGIAVFSLGKAREPQGLLQGRWMSVQDWEAGEAVPMGGAVCTGLH